MIIINWKIILHQVLIKIALWKEMIYHILLSNLIHLLSISNSTNEVIPLPILTVYFNRAQISNSIFSCVFKEKVKKITSLKYDLGQIFFQKMSGYKHITIESFDQKICFQNKM